MNLWNIPSDWKGQAAAVLGSGCSMSADVSSKVLASGMRAIAVNDQGIYKMVKGMIRPAIAPWADILYAADRDWWYHNQVAAAHFKGKKVTIHAQHGQDFPILEGTLQVGNGGDQGFDDRKTHVRTGGNSGYQAVHLAAHLGANPILLFGFDMHGTHWFGSHSWRGEQYTPRFAYFIKSFTNGEPEFRKRGIEIINCTVGSELRCFPMMGVDEGIEYAMHVVRRKKAQDERAGEVFNQEVAGGAQVA